MRIQFSAALFTRSDEGMFPRNIVSHLFLFNVDGCTHAEVPVDDRGGISVDYDMRPLAQSDASYREELAGNAPWREKVFDEDDDGSDSDGGGDRDRDRGRAAAAAASVASARAMTDRIKFHFYFTDPADENNIKPICSSHVSIEQLCEFVETGGEFSTGSNFTSNIVTMRIDANPDGARRMRRELADLRGGGAVRRSALWDSEAHNNTMQEVADIICGKFRSDAPDVHVDEDIGGEMFTSLCTAHVMQGERAFYGFYHLDFDGALHFPPWLAAYMMAETLHYNAVTVEAVMQMDLGRLTDFVASYAQSAMRSSTAAPYTTDVTLSDKLSDIFSMRSQSTVADIFKRPFSLPSDALRGTRRGALLTDDCEGDAAFMRDAVNHLAVLFNRYRSCASSQSIFGGSSSSTATTSSSSSFAAASFSSTSSTTVSSSSSSYSSSFASSSSSSSSPPSSATRSSVEMLRKKAMLLYFPKDLFDPAVMPHRAQCKLLDLMIYVGMFVRSRKLVAKITLGTANAPSLEGNDEETALSGHAFAMLVCEDEKYGCVRVLEGTGALCRRMGGARVTVKDKVYPIERVMSTINQQAPFNPFTKSDKAKVRTLMHVNESSGTFYRHVFVQDDNLIGHQIGRQKPTYGCPMKYLGDDLVALFMPINGHGVEPRRLARLRRYIRRRALEIHMPYVDYESMRRKLRWSPISLFTGTGSEQMDADLARRPFLVAMLHVATEDNNELDFVRRALKLQCDEYNSRSGDVGHMRVYDSMDGVAKVFYVFVDDLVKLGQFLSAGGLSPESFSTTRLVSPGGVGG